MAGKEKTMVSPPLNLNITYRGITELKPYARNARTHSPKQIRQIADSLTANGFINPVITDSKGTILAGHGRVEAAKLLGMEAVPTICIDHLSEDQIRAYILADNRLAEKSGWDKSILATELEYLLTIESEIEITTTGFEYAEVEQLIAKPDEQSPDDDVPDLQDLAVSKMGDIWLLGEHRVYCGDATLAASYDALMSGKKAAMTFTDPPYNIDYKGGEQKKRRKILNDNLGDQFGTFLFNVCQNVLSRTEGAVYICMASSELDTLQQAFLKAGGHWSDFLIWVKNNFTLGRSDYQRQYEPILYGWREGETHQWHGRRNQGDVWFFDKPSRSDIHPTMKPIGLVMRAIRNSSSKGEIVLDPFLGSGTTLLAAERIKRVCFAMELDPLYVDAAIRRWQNYTGREAVHADTGLTFNVTSKQQGE